MNKANSRKKGNKIKQTRHERCWLRAQKRKTARQELGGHRRAETFKRKWTKNGGSKPPKMMTLKGGKMVERSTQVAEY